MAETQVAPRPGAEDTAPSLPTLPPGGGASTPEPEYDLPWRLDVPALRTLRVVRRVVPPTKVPTLAPDDPRAVLYLPAAQRDRGGWARLGLGSAFRFSTRARLATVAVLSAGLGLAGSYGTTDAAPVPRVNPVASAHVLGVAHWAAAAPAAGRWTVSSVQLGRVDPATSCATAALPADRTVFRRSSAARGSAEQHVTSTPTPQAADALVATWLAGARSCSRGELGRTAHVRTLGIYPRVGDGLTVLGVFYGTGSHRGAHLFAVGRDGRLVTTLELDLPGAPAAIPVARFTAVAERALAELR